MTESSLLETDVSTTDLELPQKQPRISKQEARDLLAQRRANKPNAPLIVESKQLWEQLRVKTLDKATRSTILLQLLALIKGKCVEIIFKHDASRIIQCCLKYGNQEQRNSIAAELEGHYIEIAKSQYGKFLVSRVLSLCPKFRTKIFQSFHGKVKKLIRHRDASVILEECFVQYANGVERTQFLEEFYGPEFSLFKTSESRSLSQLISSQPAKEGSIMRHLREAIVSILEKGGATIGPCSMVHRIILDYFKQLSSSVIVGLAIKEATGTVVEENTAPLTPSNTLQEQNEQRIQDLIELLKDHLVHILHTREGSQVAQLALVHATPKVRKHVIKTLKTFVKKIAMEQYGYAVLISIFECVDDTVLVKKQILAELFAPGVPGAEGTDALSIQDLMCDKWSSKVMLYLVMGRTKKYLPSYLVKELEEMDAMRSRTCRKEDGLKREEVGGFSCGVLLGAIKGEALDRTIRCGVGSIVVTECLLAAATTGENIDDICAILDELIIIASRPIDVLVGDASENANNPKKPCNPVLHMRAAANAAKLWSQSAINLTDHILRTTPSTQAYEVLAKKLPPIHRTRLGVGLCKVWTSQVDGLCEILVSETLGRCACFLVSAVAIAGAESPEGTAFLHVLQPHVSKWKSLVTKTKTNETQSSITNSGKRKRGAGEYVGLEKLMGLLQTI